MPVFSLLAKPQTYTPCSTENMLEDTEYRNYWLNHFENHFNLIARLALDNYGPSAAPRVDACRTEFVKRLHAIRENPSALPRLDLLTLDMLRQEMLIKHALPDPFQKTKARENTAMLALYPHIIRDFDAHPSPDEALLLATEGVFAGNIFDLGAGATSKMFEHESPDFFKTRDSLGGKRPWLVDHYDALASRILHGPTHHQAIFFVDNAGSDFLLGVLPFARFLAQRGTRVLLAANHLPALNDMTDAEVRSLLPRVQAIDPVFDRLVKSDQIAPVNSGGIAPLIDLRQISNELNAEAKRTDLVILEGMGRALESNFEAKFTVDALKLCMIKEQITAEKHHGKIFDTVCRFDPAPRN